MDNTQDVSTGLIEHGSETTRLMKTLAQRLKYSREKAKLSQSELARRVGIKPQAIQFIESGKVYKPRNILEIAQVVGVDAVWLSTGKGEMRGHVELSPMGQIHSKVPLLTWTEATHWNTSLQAKDDMYDRVWIPTTARIGEFAFALELQSDCMEPEFTPKDIIVVDPMRPYQHRSFVIAHLYKNSEAILRQLVLDGGREYLKPLNPRYLIEERQVSDSICATVVYKSKAYPDSETMN